MPREHPRPEKSRLVLILYAPEDDTHRISLEKHLKPLVRTGKIEIRHRWSLHPDTLVPDAIGNLIQAADLILVLVTPDLIGSDEIVTAQVNPALRRRNRDGTHVVPVIVKSCRWDLELDPGTAAFCLPSSGKPVVSWSNPDEAWLEVVNGVVELLQVNVRAISDLRQITSSIQNRIREQAVTEVLARPTNRVGRLPVQGNTAASALPWAVQQGEDEHGRYAVLSVGGVLQTMRWIPPASFLMGTNEGERGRDGYEGPAHLVTLTRGFWLASTPCTQALWETVMSGNPSYFRSPERPVEQVSYDDCLVFVDRLNRRVEGLTVRLPTEAEWEWACRAGRTEATWAGDLDIRGLNDAPILDKIAWYGGNSGHLLDLTGGLSSLSWPDKRYPHEKAATRDVAQKEPNPFGLFDMLGNVYEWCADYYEPYSSRAVTDPRGPPTGQSRIVRGGSWHDPAHTMRAAHRSMFPPNTRDNCVGLRLSGDEDGSKLGSAKHRRPKGPATPR